MYWMLLHNNCCRCALKTAKVTKGCCCFFSDCYVYNNDINETFNFCFEGNDKHQMLYDDMTGTVSLLIKTIGPGDEGEYTCTGNK